MREESPQASLWPLEVARPAPSTVMQGPERANLSCLPSPLLALEETPNQRPECYSPLWVEDGLRNARCLCNWLRPRSETHFAIPEPLAGPLSLSPSPTPSLAALGLYADWELQLCGLFHHPSPCKLKAAPDQSCRWDRPLTAETKGLWNAKAEKYLLETAKSI